MSYSANYENFRQGVGVSGLMDLNQEFDDMKNALTEEIITALMRGGMIIEAEAKRRCPVDTGRLRASIWTDVERLDETTFRLSMGASGETKTTVGVEREKDWRGKSRAKYGVGTNVEYAKFVEFGTSKMAAKPFLRPAIDAKAKDVVEEIRGSLRDQINGRMIRL